MLYEHSEKRLVDRLKLEAGFHGIKLDGDSKRSTASPEAEHGVPGDPDSYSHLTEQERQELTDRMMGKHRAWAETNKPLGGKEGIDKR